MKKRILLINLLFSILVLTGCSSEPDPTYIDLQFKADNTVNPSPTQISAPVVVKIVELKESNRFESTEFLPMYQETEASLGDTLVAEEELILQPNQQKKFQFKLHEGSKFIGVFAAYRQEEQAEWRYLIPLKVSELQNLTLFFTENKIRKWSREDEIKESKKTEESDAKVDDNANSNDNPNARGRQR